MSWNTSWVRSEFEGVYVRGGSCRVRVRIVHPASGRLAEANRILADVTPEAASEQRATLRDELERRLATSPRRTVAEFGRSWLAVKKLVLDEGTHSRYEDALERHVIIHLGRVPLDELRGLRVQSWINHEVAAGYRVATIRSWFRVFRTMFLDAMVDLDLSCDVTRRIRFPSSEVSEEANALQPDQLQQFLGEMKVRFPGHYALAATLALTGLRFCHATALRWEDLDEEARLLRIQRRQLRGRIGPVTRVKRAPREYPITQELLGILQAERRRRNT
jgi:integrase